MKRGFEAVLTELDSLDGDDTGALLIAVGKTLVMKIGGASGPLYGTLFMQLGKSWPNEPSVIGLHACGMKRSKWSRRGQVATGAEDDARCLGAGNALIAQGADAARFV